MASETTTTSANDLRNSAQVLASDVLESFYGLNNAMHMVRFSSIAGANTLTKNFPTTPALAASSLTEGVNMSNTAFVTGVQTITVGLVGLMITLTDLQSAVSIADDGYYAGELGKAMANKVTTDILGQSSGWSNSVGGSGVNLTEANILDGTQTLMAGGVPGPYHGCIHSIQWRDLASAVGGTLTPAGTTGSESVRQVTNEFGAQPDGGLGQLYGVNWTTTSNVPTANTGADRSGSIVNPYNATGFVELWPIRVELEREASQIAKKIVVSSAYGVGELQDSAGVSVVTDA